MLAAITRSTIRETMRVQATNPAPVLAYAWARYAIRYMEGTMGGMLERADLTQAVLIPALMGADVLVWWAGPTAPTPRCTRSTPTTR